MVDFRDLEDLNKEKQRQKAPKVSFQRLDSDPDEGPSDQEQADENRKNLYQKISDYVSQAFDAVKSQKGFDLEPGYRLLRKMVAVQSVRDPMFIMALHLDDPQKFILRHSVNVAIFAIKIAARLGFSKNRQLQIAMTALLHDIGTVLISDKIVYKKDRLTPQELQVIRERPTHSYNILRSFDDDDHVYLAECAFQVYERIDGSGYPRGLKEDEIHQYAQIIGLVDMYEALIHSRPQRERLTHFSAVKEIIQSNKNSFQRIYLKCFLDAFSIFPIYSYVRLNSAAIGKVIETFPDHPLRPKLQIVCDSQKRRVLTERIVNLPDNPLLYVVDSISEEEVKALSS
ncbi:MAG: HD domain-containing protein [Deltaproteobacteria bacterium]|nr:MAG: HD domain-containing protein [Deltaproteobacteria bacterium]